MRKNALLMLCLAAAVGAQDFAAKADEYVQSWVRDKQFRGTVLVAKDGKPVFRKAYGQANDEWEIANTVDTKFRLGSITKQFTAVAILQLAEQGKLKLDDAVKVYYPEAPAAWDKITIHHLLNHTSEIPSYTDQPGFREQRSRDPKTPAEIVKWTQEMPLQFAPGEKFRYNNTGYVLLGMVIEKVTGVKYAAYLQLHIFEPLGMKDTGYETAGMVMKKRASGYEPDGRNAPYLDMTLPYAAGSLYGTVDDLARWDEALYTEKLLKRAWWTKMTTPGLSDYGYGLTMKPVDGKASQSHGGGINGFNTFMIRFPEEHVVAIALANQNGQAPQEIAMNLARMYFGAEVKPRELRSEVKLPAAQLDEYAGRYQLAPNFVLKVWRDGERLMTQATGQGPIEIFAKGDGQFFPKVMEAELTFARDKDGKTTGLTLRQGGRTMAAPRVGGVE